MPTLNNNHMYDEPHLHKSSELAEGITITTMSSPFKRIHQVGIAVKDIDAASEQFAKMLNVEKAPIEHDDSEGGGGAYFCGLEVGPDHLELMKEDGDGPISRFIERRGEGIYCIFMEVTDLDEAMETMAAGGASFTSEEPVVLTDATYYGTKYSRVRLTWTHPKTTHGVMIELQEFLV
jgi:methylmalonyl-CoA/ethylmalonyl-CoA epimerase